MKKIWLIVIGLVIGAWAVRLFFLSDFVTTSGVEGGWNYPLADFSEFLSFISATGRETDDLYKQVYDWLETLQKYVSIANTGELGGGDVPGTTGTHNMEAGQAYFIHTSGAGEASLS